ncbi:MAG TPA: cytidylate kinase-like family protein [Miltoncostaea sp.]|nr:cytidylate kinase-like family protein [Miltoncostaea sp.]
MTRQAVCISHAAGAGGPAVGRAVAERLGFRYVDEEVIAEAAEWADLDPAVVADAERRKPLVERVLGGLAYAGPGAEFAAPDAWGWADMGPAEGQLRALIIEVLQAFADRGSVVIVSHAASFALADRGVLRVLVTASPETRAVRVAEDRGTSPRYAARQVRKEDEARADYLQRFHGVGAELPTHYDVVINTDALSLEEAARLIAGAAT